MFLQCRGEWLQSQLAAIPSVDAEQHVSFCSVFPANYVQLRQATECNRVYLFDIISQYRPIFSDETSDDTSLRILCSWLMDKIFHYVTTLERYWYSKNSRFS